MKELKELEIVVARGRMAVDTVSAFTTELGDCGLIYIENVGRKTDLEESAKALNALTDPEYIEQNTEKFESLQGQSFSAGLGWARRNSGKQYKFYGVTLDDDATDEDVQDAAAEGSSTVGEADFQRILWQPENRYDIVDQSYERLSHSIASRDASLDAMLYDLFKAPFDQPELQALISDNGKVTVGVICSVLHTQLAAKIKDLFDQTSLPVAVVEKVINQAEIDELLTLPGGDLMFQKLQQPDEPLLHKAIDYLLLTSLQIGAQLPDATDADGAEPTAEQIKQGAQSMKPLEEYDETELAREVDELLKRLSAEQQAQ